MTKQDINDIVYFAAKCNNTSTINTLLTLQHINKNDLKQIALRAFKINEPIVVSNLIAANFLCKQDMITMAHDASADKNISLQAIKEGNTAISDYLNRWDIIEIAESAEKMFKTSQAKEAGLSPDQPKRRC